MFFVLHLVELCQRGGHVAATSSQLTSLGVELCPALTQHQAWQAVCSPVNFLFCATLCIFALNKAVHIGCLFHFPTPGPCLQLQTHKACVFLWCSAGLGGVRCLVRSRQLQGVISVPFLGHWLWDAPSHWEPRVLLLSLCRRSQPHLQLNPPSTSYTHPPSDLEQSSHIQTSSLTLRAQSPRRCRGETRKDCFLIAGERRKGGKVFEIFRSEAVSLERGGFVLFYIWCR